VIKRVAVKELPLQGRRQDARRKGSAARTLIPALILLFALALPLEAQMPVLIPSDPETMVKGEPALIYSGANKLGLARWQKSFEDARADLNREEWEKTVADQRRSAMQQLQLERVVRQFLADNKSSTEATSRIAELLDNNRKMLYATAKLLANSGNPLMAASLYRFTVDNLDSGSEADRLQSLLAQVRCLEEAGVKSDALEILSHPLFAEPDGGSDVERYLKEQGLLAKSELLSELDRKPEALNEVSVIPPESPLAGETLVLRAQLYRELGDWEKLERVIAQIEEEAFRPDYLLEAEAERAELAEARGDLAEAAEMRSAIVLGSSGFDTLYATVRQLERIGQLKRELSGLKQTALVEGDLVGWAEASRLDQTFSLLEQMNQFELLEGELSLRLLNENYRLELASVFTLVELDFEIIPLGERESFLTTSVLAQLKLACRLSNDPLLMEPTSSVSSDGPLIKVKESLAGVLRVRDRVLESLAGMEDWVLVELEQAEELQPLVEARRVLSESAAVLQNDGDPSEVLRGIRDALDLSPPTTEQAALALMASRLEARHDSRNAVTLSGEYAGNAVYSAPAMASAPMAWEARAMAEGMLRTPDRAIQAVFWEKAWAAAGPELGRSYLLEAAKSHLLMGGASAQKARAYSACLLRPENSWAVQKSALSLIAESFAPPVVEDPKAGLDSLGKWISKRPSLGDRYGSELWRAFGDVVVERVGAVQWADTALAKARILNPDEEMESRLDLLEQKLVELRGSDQLSAWNWRVEQVTTNWKRVNGPAWFGTERGRSWRERLVTFSYEALNIAIERAKSTRDENWGDRAVASAELIEWIAPADPRTARSWANVVTVMETSKQTNEVELAEMHAHIAERWPLSPAAELSADRALALADKAVRKAPSPKSDSMLVAAAHLWAERSTDEEAAAKALLKAAVTLRRGEQYPWAIRLFHEIESTYPTLSQAEDALEGWFECQLALGRLPAVKEKYERVMASGTSGRSAAIARKALSRAEASEAKMLISAGLTGEAREAFERAGGLDSDPEISAWALLEAGRLAVQEGRLNDAASAFQTVLEWYPEQDAAPPAAVQIGRVKELNIRAARREPDAIEHRDIAEAYANAARLYPTSDEAPTALVAASKHFKEAGDKNAETRMLVDLVRGSPSREGVAGLVRNAGIEAWLSGDLQNAHNLFLAISQAVPGNREAIAAFTFLGDEAQKAGKTEDAVWAYTMAGKADTGLRKNGELSDRPFAGQAELARLQLTSETFRSIRYSGSDRQVAAQRERKEKLGKGLIAEYRAVYNGIDVSSVRSLLGVASVQGELALAEQNRLYLASLTPESLAVKNQRGALASWAAWKSSIETLELAKSRLEEITALRESQLAAGRSMEEVSILLGFQAEGLRLGVEPGAVISGLNKEIVDNVALAYESAIKENVELVKIFAALPDRGTTELERSAYRYALIDDVLRARIRFTLELIIEARSHGTDGGVAKSATGNPFEKTAFAREPIEVAKVWVDKLVPELLAAYASRVDQRQAGPVSREGDEEVAQELLDDQQLVNDLFWLETDLARDRLEATISSSAVRKEQLDYAKSVMREALENAARLDKLKENAQEAAERYGLAYEASGQERLLDAVRLQEDLMHGWERGAARLLEPAWAIAAELGLRPSPEIDRIARELAKRAPGDYAYAVGLKEKSNSFVTDKNWVWRPYDGATTSPVVVIRESAGWKANGSKGQPKVVGADSGPGDVWIEGVVTVEGTISSASLSISAQRHYEVYLNGRFAAETIESPGLNGEPETWDVRDLVGTGTNDIRVRISGAGSGNAVAVRLDWKTVGEVTDNLKAVFPVKGVSR